MKLIEQGIVKPQGLRVKKFTGEIIIKIYGEAKDEKSFIRMVKS